MVYSWVWVWVLCHKSRIWHRNSMKPTSKSNDEQLTESVRVCIVKSTWFCEFPLLSWFWLHLRAYTYVTCCTHLFYYFWVIIFIYLTIICRIYAYRCFVSYFPLVAMYFVLSVAVGFVSSLKNRYLHVKFFVLSIVFLPLLGSLYPSMLIWIWVNVVWSVCSHSAHDFLVEMGCFLTIPIICVSLSTEHVWFARQVLFLHPWLVARWSLL